MAIRKYLVEMSLIVDNHDVYSLTVTPKTLQLLQFYNQLILIVTSANQLIAIVNNWQSINCNYK